MIRILIGSILGGIVQWMIGAIAWATPIGKLAFVGLDDAKTADLQMAMARTLTPTGSGTYFIPSPETSAGTTMLGRGPVGLIFFNTNGFPPMDWGAIMVGLVLSIIMLFIVGVALSQIDGFAARIRVTLLFGVATLLYFVLSLPVYNVYMPWAWWIFLAVEEGIAFGAAAFILIRWFMPPTPPATTTTLH
jgi:hypothetical protein